MGGLSIHFTTISHIIFTGWGFAPRMERRMQWQISVYRSDEQRTQSLPLEGKVPRRGG